MARVFLFPEQFLAAKASSGSPETLVAMDPVTGETEVIVEDFVWEGDEDGPVSLEIAMEDYRSPPPDEPFRAVVVPRRLRGVEARAALLPGARSKPVVVLRPDGVPVDGGVAPRGSDSEILLTEVPIRVTSTGSQALELARDVLGFDELTVELQVLSVSGGAAPSISVELLTGMTMDSSQGWVSAGAFARVASAPSAELKSYTGLLRYVRWNVTDLSATEATFFLSAIGRRWSGAS